MLVLNLFLTGFGLDHSCLNSVRVDHIRIECKIWQGKNMFDPDFLVMFGHFIDLDMFVWAWGMGQGNR